MVYQIPQNRLLGTPEGYINHLDGVPNFLKLAFGTPEGYINASEDVLNFLKQVFGTPGGRMNEFIV